MVMNEILKKKIEEGAEDYARIVNPSFINGSFDKYAIAQAFEDGAIWALGHQWISVEEALPERGCEVLVLDKRHETQIAVYIGLEWWHNPIGYGAVYPTHWMPIPELNEK